MSTTRYALRDRESGKYLHKTNKQPPYVQVDGGPLEQDPTVWYDGALAEACAREAGRDVTVVRWHREGD